MSSETLVQESTNLSKQILIARQEAKYLYAEVEKNRERVQDTSLIEFSRNLKSIPSNQNLVLYNTLKGHRNKISKIRWGSDSSSLLSASQDGFMIIWDTISGFKLNAIPLDKQWVLTCAYSPSRRLVASAGLNNVCTVYKVNPPMLSFDNEDNYVNSKNRTQQPTAKHQMAGGLTQSIRSLFKGHTAYISECDFFNDNLILTASGDMSCALWDISKGSRTREFVDHLGDVFCLAKINGQNTNENSNNPIFISGASDGYARVWDSRQRNSAQTFFVSNSDVNCLKTFPETHSFAAGSDDGYIRLFDLRSDCELAHYSLNKAPPSPKYSPNTISTKQNHNISAFSSSTGNLNHNSSSTQSIHSSMDTPGVISIDFSKSGRLLYACYAEAGCVIWDTLKSEVVGTVEGHSNRINEVSCSPDGLGICTASWDATIKVWSV